MIRPTRTAVALLALCGLAGCADLEENPVSGVTQEYFGTPEGADAAVTGTYARLRDYYGQEQEVRIGMAGTDSWKRGEQCLANGCGPWNDYNSQLGPSLGQSLRDLWQQSYFAINSANTAIKFIGESTQIPEAQKNVRLGEARFLRALFYYNLVRNYGDVQLNLEPTQGVVVEAHRTPVAEVYAQAIVPDLEFAVANLPAVQPQQGRATKGAAQTLLAEALLTRGAPGDFDRARDLASAVISSGTYALNPTYRELFCGPERPAGPCDFVASIETNKEYLFAVQFTGDASRDQFGNSLHWYWTMGYDVVGAPNLGRTLEYDRPFRRLSPTRYTLDLWNRAVDSRYRATFQTVWRSNSGTPGTAAQGGDTAIYLPGTDTVPTENKGKRYKVFGQNDYTELVFPTLLKWLDQTKSSVAAQQSQRDRHLWRLADVYLLRAEANIRAGRPSDAIADFNVLRRRAAIPTGSTANDLNAAQLDSLNGGGDRAIELLLNERARELTGEEQRWYVLVRLNKLLD
ncbi:MAG TPA: RagB/SusD family nutrient uptake outer membrane protein, partial [Longimicrobiaceae bacterium]